jgi:hypothetical protein
MRVGLVGMPVRAACFRVYPAAGRFCGDAGNTRFPSRTGPKQNNKLYNRNLCNLFTYYNHN